MLSEEIRQLAVERKAVILAHNYCLPEIQEVADFTGDSLELARKATEVEADTIVFCGVYFMAETAKILNPRKKVLIPDRTAGCPMADMISAEQVRELKAKHPGAKVVCYVNSTAAVKAECDLCVTSGNARQVLAQWKGEEIIFVPDQHLGGYVSNKLGEKYICWPGYCPVHDRLELRDVAAGRRQAGADAPVLVHPECAKAVREAADKCLSTGAMCRYVKDSAASTFVIGTERGILHRLEKENPEKRFVAIGELECADMKKLTLEKLRDTLFFERNEVMVDRTIAEKAKAPIERMLEMTTLATCALVAQPFGTLSDGREAKLWTIEGKGGLKVSVSDYGGRIVKVLMPSKDGTPVDVTLGWNSAGEYEKFGFCNGTLVGRFGNRIADGKFTLNGVEYALAINEKTSTRNCNLHGGPQGWDSKLWQVTPFNEGDVVGLKLALTSEDGDMGFPGKVNCTVTYKVTPDNVLVLEYAADTDKPTVINLTHHGYWNMAGEASGSVIEQVLQVAADEYLETTEGLIPTKAASVEGTAFDFRQAQPLSAKTAQMQDAKYACTSNWFDHCFVIRGKPGELRFAASLKDPKSGRKLEVWTTEPGMQMYGAQDMDGTMPAKEAGKTLVKYAGFALETQHYPDSPNHPEFPTTVLNPGEKFVSRTEYRFLSE